MANATIIRMLTFVTVIGLWGTSPALSQQSQPKDISIVAYNVHLLPKVALKVAGKRSNSEYRAQAIAAQLAQDDIVGICEAFDRTYSHKLIYELQRQSENGFSIVKGPGRSGRHLIGSGLLLASRFPTMEVHTATYDHASRFLTSGLKADGFAAKGALHVRLKLDETSDAMVDCFLTHLESRSEEARDSQISQFARFVNEHSDDSVPRILLGDFNIDAAPADSGSQYNKLLALLTEANWTLVDTGRSLATGPAGTSEATAHDGGRRIDYIMLSQKQSVSSVRLDALRTQHLRLLDEKVEEGSLSDHSAVRSVLRAQLQVGPYLR